MPVERLKLEDVDKAEGILQAIRETLDKSGQSQQNLKKYSDEFYSLISHREKSSKEVNRKRVIAEKQDLCQVETKSLPDDSAKHFVEVDSFFRVHSFFHSGLNASSGMKCRFGIM